MNNKKGFLLFLLVTLFVGCAPKGAKQAGVQLMGSVGFTSNTTQMAKDTIALGTVNEGEVITGLFAIENNSDTPLAILDIQTGCGCTSVQYDNQPIASRQMRTVEFKFDSKGRFGSQIKDIMVVTSMGSAVVTLTGMVK